MIGHLNESMYIDTETCHALWVHILNDNYDDHFTSVNVFIKVVITIWYTFLNKIVVKKCMKFKICFSFGFFQTLIMSLC